MLFERSHDNPTGQKPLSGRSVLVVEDEPLIGMGMQQAIEDSGGDVVWVQTDSAAYAALQGRDRRFDTIVLDINLGEGTTGFDVARAARALAPDVAVVFSSGSPASWVDEFGVSGALFLSKPCTESALIAALERVRTLA